MAETRKVRAWAINEFGKGDEVVKLQEVTFPATLGPNELFLKVKAASINPVDGYIVTGKFSYVDVKFPYVPALDFSGIVEEIGSAVTKFKPGDEVFGYNKFGTYGTLSEYTVVEESTLSKKPASISFSEAAAFPVVALTALQAFNAGGLKEGDKLLITAGAGGVGIHGIQIAKVVFKASEIVVTASKAKHELLKKLGATKTIDYHEENFEETLSDFDFVLDATKESKKGLKIVKPSGSVVTIIDFEGPEEVKKVIVQSIGADLDKLAPLVESGDLKIILDENSPWKFEEADKAFARQLTTRATGKVVVEM